MRLQHFTTVSKYYKTVAAFDKIHFVLYKFYVAFSMISNYESKESIKTKMILLSGGKGVYKYSSYYIFVLSGTLFFTSNPSNNFAESNMRKTNLQKKKNERKTMVMWAVAIYAQIR